MLERVLYEYYRIYPDQQMNIGDDVVVVSEGKQYLVREVNKYLLTRLEESKTMGDWLMYYGEQDVATLLMRHDQKAYFKLNDQYYVVFELPQLINGKSNRKDSVGKKLASFHQKGFQYKREGKSGETINWKERWEKRLDQLESWYVHVTKSERKTKIDEQFCLTFPYFLGITENAIQIMADIFIDYTFPQILQKQTICHRRFQDRTWLTLEDGYVSRVKVPTDFSYDHYVRDIADYVRAIWYETGEMGEATQRNVTNFLNDYEKIQPLSLIDQKLLLARLLFPVHYFETVEQYYQLTDEGKKEKMGKECIRIFSKTASYERFILFLFYRYPNIKQSMQIPDWLIYHNKNTVFLT